jgi:transcriptional regulator with XRE-family HTH domain
MPKFPDHPLTVAREHAGLTQQELARRAGINRLTVAKIEGAATRSLSADTRVRLERELHMPAGRLQYAMDSWFAHLKPSDHLGTAVQSLLRLSPEGLTARFASFAAWRQAIAPSAEFFAALIGVHRATVTDYEKGIRTNGMSSNLASALLTLGITAEYLTALRRLPPTSEHREPRIGRFMLDEKE